MKYADYIKQIEIDSLWEGRKHIVWTLDPRVNILSGVNGGGKSTILLRTMKGAKGVHAGEIPGIHVTTEPQDAEYVRFDVVTMPEVRSDFDLNLQTLLDRYDAYEHDEQQQQRLFDTIDRLFHETEKHVDRSQKKLTLVQWGKDLDMHVLSNGEKQMLTILLTVYMEGQQSYVLFMDEPEVSLHVEWQKELIDIILHLNPNVQIILTTHSPAVIMNGWIDKVTEVSEIEVKE